MTHPEVETAEFWAIPGLTEERAAAARDAWSAFCTSRAVIWGAAIVAVLIFGWEAATANRLDPLYVTRPFDSAFGNLLVAPGARFDSAWYLTIAQHGYDAGSRAAFFPVLPALLAAGGRVVGSALIAGMAISAISGLAALYPLHRLVALDFDLDRARTTVWLAAWFPGAMVLSAVYSEALLLLFSVGSLYAARLGRWPIAGSLGGLAAATRSGGVVLLVPLLIVYLYGPRADRPGEVRMRGARPRHRVGPDLLWILFAVPAGLAVYLAYLGAATGDPMAVFSAQAAWHRSFLPLGGIPLGLWSALRCAFELVVPGVGRQASSVAHGLPRQWLDVREMLLCGFMLTGLWLTYESARRLTPAYSAYAALGLALPLSVPAAGFPLMSLPRFEFVLFPLWIALALWTHERRRFKQVLLIFGALLAVSSGLFAVWVMAP